MNTRRTLNKYEMAAVYRQLNPNRRFLGDEPEEWTADILVKAILASLTVTIRG